MASEGVALLLLLVDPFDCTAHAGMTPPDLADWDSLLSVRLQ